MQQNTALELVEQNRPRSGTSPSNMRQMTLPDHFSGAKVQPSPKRQKTVATDCDSTFHAAHAKMKAVVDSEFNEEKIMTRKQWEASERKYHELKRAVMDFALTYEKEASDASQKVRCNTVV